MELGDPFLCPENTAVAGILPNDNELARKWSPIQFSSTLNIGGALLGKRASCMPVESMKLTIDGEERTFVKVGKTREWIYKLTTGDKKNLCGGLKRSQILERICTKIKTDPSLQNNPADAEDHDDPMEQLDSPDVLTCRKTLRTRTNTRVPTRVITLEFPALCPSAHPNSTAQAKIRVLNKWARSQLWLDVRDLSWLLLYMTEELATQNVSMKPANAEEDLKQNCNVPGLNMRLIFAKGKPVEYLAKFFDGPCLGQEARTRLAPVPVSKWERALTHSDRWNWSGAPFNDTPEDEIHRALHYLLMEHCAGILVKSTGGSEEELADPFLAITQWAAAT